MMHEYKGVKIHESKGHYWVVGVDGHKAFESLKKAQNYIDKHLAGLLA